MLTVSSHAVTDTGLRRPANEDSLVARPGLGLFVVCDGMGGHAAGEVASRAAADTIEAFVQHTDGADATFTWPYGSARSRHRRQPPRLGIPAREPRDLPAHGRPARVQGHGHHGRVSAAGPADLAVRTGGGERARQRTDLVLLGDGRACRRFPRVPLARGRARADHTRPFVGRGADCLRRAVGGGGARRIPGATS